MPSSSSAITRSTSSAAAVGEEVDIYAHPRRVSAAPAAASGGVPVAQSSASAAFYTTVPVMAGGGPDPAFSMATQPAPPTSSFSRSASGGPALTSDPATVHSSSRSGSATTSAAAAYSYSDRYGPPPPRQPSLADSVYSHATLPLTRPPLPAAHGNTNTNHPAGASKTREVTAQHHSNSVAPSQQPPRRRRTLCDWDRLQRYASAAAHAAPGAFPYAMPRHIAEAEAARLAPTDALLSANAAVLRYGKELDPASLAAQSNVPPPLPFDVANAAVASLLGQQQRTHHSGGGRDGSLKVVSVAPNGDDRHVTHLAPSSSSLIGDGAAASRRSQSYPTIVIPVGGAADPRVGMGAPTPSASARSGEADFTSRALAAALSVSPPPPDPRVDNSTQQQQQQQQQNSRQHRDTSEVTDGSDQQQQLLVAQYEALRRDYEALRSSQQQQQHVRGGGGAEEAGEAALPQRGSAGANGGKRVGPSSANTSRTGSPRKPPRVYTVGVATPVKERERGVDQARAARDGAAVAVVTAQTPHQTTKGTAAAVMTRSGSGGRSEQRPPASFATSLDPDAAAGYSGQRWDERPQSPSGGAHMHGMYGFGGGGGSAATPSSAVHIAVPLTPHSGSSRVQSDAHYGKHSGARGGSQASADHSRQYAAPLEGADMPRSGRHYAPPSPAAAVAADGYTNAGAYNAYDDDGQRTAVSAASAATTTAQPLVIDLVLAGEAYAIPVHSGDTSAAVLSRFEQMRAERWAAKGPAEAGGPPPLTDRQLRRLEMTIAAACDEVEV